MYLSTNLKANSDHKKFKVAWIHCNYDATRINRCLSLAEKFLKKLELLDSALLICVNNSNVSLIVKEHPIWKIFQGSNDSREFSAWSEGWNIVNESEHDFDVLVLTNDTFPFHQPFELLAPLFRLGLKRLIKKKSIGWALGLVERGFDYDDFSEYITTFFVAFDRVAAMRVMSSIVDSVLEHSIAERHLINGKIILSKDKCYEDKINGWLLKPGNQSWYAAAPLTEKNYSFMADKARSIILEHSMSVNLKKNRIDLISCFDFPLGFFARWCYRFSNQLRRYS